MWFWPKNYRDSTHRVKIIIIIDHAVGPERFHKIDIARAANRGHLGAERLCDLDCERSDPTRRAVDQNFLSGLNVPFVEQADALVAEVIKRLADSFAAERSKLEGQWGRGDDVSTEDLRIALRRYRSFFDRLLSV
jgi:hypothetical protein